MNSKNFSEADLIYYQKNFQSHLIPQYKFIYKNNQLAIDFLGKYENFYNDVNFLLKKFNIDKNICHINIIN